MNIEDLQSVIGIKFKDPDLYEVAMTHRSYLNERGQRQYTQHNERLEFLGDAVLELVVTEYLYKNYTDPEGVLTNWRSALVRTESLSEVADVMGLEKFLRLSKGEKKGSMRARRQILANTLEALIGAIYIDQGYEPARVFISENIISTLSKILDEGSWLDAKTKYQETVQESEGHTPEYKVLDENGPDHDKRFTVGVYVDGELRGQGEGTSKQTAQQKAAEHALKVIEPEN